MKSHAPARRARSLSPLLPRAGQVDPLKALLALRAAAERRRERNLGRSAAVEEPEFASTADPAQLEQVFANLIGNALNYRREDSPPAIRVSARRLDGTVEFAVADSGIGIEPQYFDRIFEMFRRLHTHDGYEGTGIGLAVVKKIIERHGGRIRGESTPGEGSTFVFTLPAA